MDDDEPDVGSLDLFSNAVGDNDVSMGAIYVRHRHATQRQLLRARKDREEEADRQRRKSMFAEHRRKASIVMKSAAREVLSSNDGSTSLSLCSFSNESNESDIESELDTELDRAAHHQGRQDILNIRHFEMASEDVDMLVRERRTTQNVSTINAGHNRRVSDCKMAMLLDVFKPEVAILDSNPQISDLTLEMIAETRLVEVDISDCALQDEDVRMLLRFLRMMMMMLSIELIHAVLLDVRKLKRPLLGPSKRIRQVKIDRCHLCNRFLRGRHLDF
eukprot:g3168.t1